ncbi:hypothetical protein R6Q59_011129 [Mikania micrantha]
MDSIIIKLFIEYSDDDFEEGSSSHPNEVAVVKKAMCVRRGHTRDVGCKPSSSDEVSSFVGHHEQEMTPETPPAFTQAQIESLFQDATFREELSKFIAKMKPDTNGKDDSNEGNK